MRKRISAAGPSQMSEGSFSCDVAHLFSADHTIEATASHKASPRPFNITVAESSSEPRRIITRHFKKTKSGPVYIFGAAAGNSSRLGKWDLIKIYAMVNTTYYKSPSFHCCLWYKFDNATHVEESPAKHTRRHWAEAELVTYHLTCPNILHTLPKIPSAVGLSRAGSTCKNEADISVELFLPQKETKTRIVLGTQVAHGNLSSELIIEWLETYKYLGVDKIVSYFYKNLNEDALKVLKYYHNSGFLDLYYFVPAAGDVRQARLHEQSNQTYNDLTSVVYDTFERMSGYTYFGIIDFDEFLIPNRNLNLKQLMSYLFKRYRKAAGFIFKTQYFYLSWGPSGNISDLIMGRYLNRTADKPERNKAKLIYKPEYIAPGGLSTHLVTPIKGFRRPTFSCKEIPFCNVITRERSTFLTACVSDVIVFTCLVPRTSGRFLTSLKILELRYPYHHTFDMEICICYPENDEFESCISDRYVAWSAYAYIRHYRKCRTKHPDVLKQCLNTFKRVKDVSMANWAERIQYNVRFVRKQVFGRQSARWRPF